MTSYALELENVQHAYGKTVALSGVSLRLPAGHIGCLLGPSGSGKTTVLRCIAGFEAVNGGSIKIKGETVSASGFTLAPEKRRLGIVFQEHALFPHMSVLDNVTYGLSGQNKGERISTAMRFLRQVDLDGFAARFPHELSGGQQQRVALARALAPGPDLLLLDEPFASLDPLLRGRMQRELRALLKSFGVTTLFITHHQDEAFDIADELGVMVERRIEQWGHPRDLYERPMSRIVAEFLGYGTFLNATVNQRGAVETELGELPGNGDEIDRGAEKLVLLRPEDLEIDDTQPRLAEVRDVTFRGAHRIYFLRLPSGAELQCFCPARHEERPVGARVGLRCRVDHAVVLDR